MASSLEPLEKLGEHVALLLDEAAPDRARAIDEAREAFLHGEVAQRARWASLRLRWVSAIAVVIAVVATTVIVLDRHATPLTFAVEGAPGSPKTWLAAPKHSALRLDFSDGTKIRLEGDSRARVQDIDSTGASLGLEAGHLHAEVVHTKTSVWKVAAGPFVVNVTGTVFDVNWDPSTQVLAVSVARGSVLVGDSSSGVAQAVRASETLHATTFERRFVMSSQTDPLPVESRASAAEHGPPLAESVAPPVDGTTPDAVAPEAVAPEAATIEPALPTTARHASPSKVDDSLGDWRAFAKRGALREAFASAEASGFRQATESATPSELLSLGDGARLSGNAERATFALLSLRQRFPSDSRRAAAAFSLGKVAFDQRKAYEQAAQWFATSLREQPTGPLAREASGRLIESSWRAHDAAGAERAARDYLGKYPEGPHADLARSVLR